MINLIQIGANVGKTPQGEDIIWPIIRERNWNAIFVEPIRSAFELLQINYNDLKGSFFENVAIMDYDGEVLMYFGLDTRMASTKPNHHQYNNQCWVPCITLTTLVTKYDMLDQPFEMLQMDTEGMDGDIICCTDFNRVLPRYIRYEFVHMKPDKRQATIEYLEGFDYKIIDDMFETVEQDDLDIMMERQNA